MKGRKRERESGVWAGKFSKVELGNRCEGGGAALKGGGCKLHVMYAGPCACVGAHVNVCT